MKRPIVLASLVASICVSALVPGAHASWSASGASNVGSQTSAQMAVLKKPTLSGTSCNSANRIVAQWTLGAGVLTPASWVLVDRTLGVISLGSVTTTTSGGTTTYAATSTNAYKNAALSLTMTGRFGSTSWHGTSASVGIAKC